jgi:phenylacetate-CoA ligase
MRHQNDRHNKLKIKKYPSRLTPLKQIAWWLRYSTIGRSKLRYYRSAKTLQTAKADEVFDWQRKKLEALLSHAYRHVPYYSKILSDASVIDNGKVRLDNFQKIPLLDKKTLRSNFPQLISEDAAQRGIYENSSGGSTGEPIKLIQDEFYFAWKTAMKFIFDRWTGYSFAEKKFILWGSQRDVATHSLDARKKLRRWLDNEIWLNAYLLNDRLMASYIGLIEQHRPSQILGYSDSLLQIAKFVIGKRISVTAPRAIISTAGPLTASGRKTIEEAFKCPVFNRYGSREAGDIACECGNKIGLHVSVPTHFVEILSSDGSPSPDGTPGEIVITMLTNFSMPLIRYRIGDVGAWCGESCNCGINWPLISTIDGRVTDNFIRSDGSFVYGGFFRQLLVKDDWINKFQIVQEDVDRVCILVVPEANRNDIGQLRHRTMDRILPRIRAVMGDGCRVELDCRQEILPTSSGKYRFTISRVAERRHSGSPITFYKVGRE